MAAYGDFARVYDALMTDFDYPKWARHYLDLLERQGVCPKSLVDCACGTGSLTVEFVRLGITKVTGVDLSDEMLSVAQEKARGMGLSIPFVKQDMMALALPRKVDALVCGCDGVNYLTTLARLSAFFQRAFETLRPGGALAFDISTARKLRDEMAGNVFAEETDDLAYLWWNRWHAESRTTEMELTFFTREPDGRYHRFEERHTQRAHTLDELSDALRGAGFDNIQFYGEFGFEPPEDDARRVHVAAVKPFGGTA